MRVVFRCLAAVMCRIILLVMAASSLSWAQEPSPAKEDVQKAFQNVLRAVRAQDDDAIDKTVDTLLAFKEDAVPVLSEALGSEDLLHRLMATALLKDLGPAAKPAEAQLSKVLDDEDVRVRRLAAQSLQKFPASPGVVGNPLLRALTQDEDAQVRIHAAQALAELEGKAAPAVPALVQRIIEDKDANVRDVATHALWRIGEPSTTHLIKLLGHPDEQVRRLAIAAVHRIPSSMPSLIKLLGDPNETLQIGGYASLMNMGEAAVPPLIQALSSDNATIASNAASVLGTIGEPAIPALVAALKSDEVAVRRGAATSFMEMETAKMKASAKPPIEALTAALGDDDEFVRGRLTVALGEMGSHSAPAVAALTRVATSDESRGVRLAAGVALAKIGPAAKPAVAALAEVIRKADQAPQRRADAADVLGELGLELDTIIPLLVSLLRDESEVVRDVVTETLWESVGAPAIPALLAEIDGDDLAAKEHASSALMDICARADEDVLANYPQLVPVLVRAARHRNEAILSNASSALFNMGEAAIPGLLLLLEHELPQTRFFAAKYLGDCILDEQDEDQLTAVDTALQNALRDEDVFVRVAAAKSLEYSWSVDTGEGSDVRASLVELLPHLVEAVTDDDHFAFGTAASVLADMGNDAAPAVPKLVEALGVAKREHVLATIIETLGEIGPSADDAAAPLTAYLSSDNLAVPASVALGNIAAGGDAALAALTEALGDENTRYHAVNGLQLAGSRGVPAMTRALKSGDEEFCAHACLQLSEMERAAKAALPALLDTIRHKDLLVRLHAAQAMAAIDPENDAVFLALIKSTSDFVEGLQHPNREARLAAVAALGVAGKESGSAVASLIAATRDKDAEILRQALHSLQVIGPNAKTAVPRLIEILQGEAIVVEVLDYPEDLRENAVLTIGAIGPDARPATKALIDLFHQLDSWSGQSWVVQSLGQIRANEGVDLLVKILGNREDYDSSLRAAAATSLGGIGEGARPATPALVETLKDDDEEIRWVAAEALGKINVVDVDQVVPALIETFRDPFSPARYAATRSVAAMGLAATPYLAAALESENEDIAIGAAIAFGNMGRANLAVPALMNALKSKSLDTRGHAAAALHDMGAAAKNARPALLRIATDPEEDWRLRIMAAKAALTLDADPQEIVPFLVEFASIDVKTEDDMKARVVNASMLWGIGEAASAAVPALTKALEHELPLVRATAAGALTKIEPENKAARDVLAKSVPALIDVAEISDIQPFVFGLFSELGPGAVEAVPILEKIASDNKDVGMEIEEAKETREAALRVLARIRGEME